MASYREIFKLDTRDIDLIEHALREQVAQTARPEEQAEDETDAAYDPRTIQDLLGRLHEQKIFYSQTGRTSCPNG